MSEYHDSQLTAFGADLAQRASNGDTKFTITKATSTADDLSQTDLSQLITLPHEKQTGEIDRILPDPNGGTKVKGTKVSFDNLNLTESYPIQAMALYAKEDVDGAKEQLYAVTTAADPETMPKSDSTVMFTFSASIYVIVGNTSQVTINVNPDSFATKEYVADAIANINFDTSDLAKLSQDNYYTGDNQFKYDPVNKDGDAYGLAKNIDTKVTDNADGTITVNGKTYTPADDSEVVHTTDTSNWQKSKVTDDTGMPLLMLGDTDDLSTKINGLPNGYFTIYCTAKTLNNPSASPKRGIIHITASGVAGSGILFSEDKNAYIITMLTGTVTYTQIANDSTVAHLSGANNFDTVPTVDDNPLLLASSLPSDLARTGQAQTFTAAQTFSIAPVINDASTDKGDNQAATMADLKSVEKSAWHQLNNAPQGGTFLYRIDQSSKKIYISYSLDCSFIIGSGTTIADFSSIVNNIKTISGRCFQYDLDADTFSSNIILSIISPANITVNSGHFSYVNANIHTSITDGAYFTYDSLK
ncbi:hypothetical protein GQR93_09670 [Lentilactobacillus hilgardii]|uniref:Lower baseplate protein N-terminal domain-containing protein n=1 Tax=Lentilactobacillus hilgardii TaxID=1588 RepID=A0A6P1E9K7_LENHI|nr:hypothetical protein [Lentilactobacillus hilgardii]QHB52442.1 hypothetical protein GQR93_09670 [Lentilactobacillus hilgardii]